MARATGSSRADCNAGLRPNNPACPRGWAHRPLPRAGRRQPCGGASTRVRVPPMDYGDKLPPSPWYIFTPPHWRIISPPLTRRDARRARPFKGSSPGPAPDGACGGDRQRGAAGLHGDAGGQHGGQHGAAADRRPAAVALPHRPGLRCGGPGDDLGGDHCGAGGAGSGLHPGRARTGHGGDPRGGAEGRKALPVPYRPRSPAGCTIATRNPRTNQGSLRLPRNARSPVCAWKFAYHSANCPVGIPSPGSSSSTLRSS